MLGVQEKTETDMGEGGKEVREGERNSGTGIGIAGRNDSTLGAPICLGQVLSLSPRLSKHLSV